MSQSNFEKCVADDSLSIFFENNPERHSFKRNGKRVLIESLFSFFVLDLIPFPSIKLPKLKKLRQWSHDSLANLSQLTSRPNNVNPKHSNSRASLDETALPTNGISTISSAIREQKIDPKRDNHGLYALKCDRSSSLANARRGILLNLPTTMIKTKAEINSFHSMERNHEVFKSCETSVDPTAGTMYDGATSSASGNEGKAKIEPPPRRKKRPTATRQIVAKPHKKPNLKQANQCVVKAESLEKNDSSLYRIVNSSETAKVSIEEAKKEHVVTMVKPKVQKAMAVKAKPVQQQVAKVKSYEWNKHQRKASIGNVIKPHFTKRYVASESSGSFKSESSVDIFQSNRLMDQKKVFDEFDALFDKSKETTADLSQASPESAFNKLKALKFESQSSFLREKGAEVNLRQAKADDTANSTPANVKSQNFCQKNSPRAKNAGLPPPTDSEGASSKPKIIYEQPKASGGIIKKKILYYDDKHEFQQLIMNQTQATTIINNHFNAAVLPSSAKSVLEGRVPISCSPQSVVVDTAATGQFDLNGNDACDDYQRSYHNPKTTTDTTNSNSLRIFSNEGIFVFNL